MIRKLSKYYNLFWVLVATFFVAPSLYILISVANFSAKEFVEIVMAYDLVELVFNTLILVLSVSIFSSTIGILAAWFVTVYKFPFKGVLSVLLTFPLAFPAYVLAFSWTGFFGFTGILNKVVMSNSVFYLDIFRNMFGAILVLSFSLYPYIYLICKSAFETLGKRTMEITSLHGYSSFQAFVRIIIPQTKPWIISGIILVSFEVLSDFGAVSILGVNTFTTAIYKAWYGYFKFDHALILALFLLLKIIILLSILKLVEGSKRYYQTGRNEAYVSGIKATSKTKGSMMFIFLLLVCLLSFFIPLIQLIHWTLYASSLSFSNVKELSANTFILSFISAALIVILTTIVGYLNKYCKGKFGVAVEYLIKSGYAYPGTVLAIAVFASLSALSQWVEKNLGIKFVLQFTIIPLVLGYVIRYSAVAFSSINSGFHRLKGSVMETLSLMNISPILKVYKVVLPALKPSLIYAFVLTFIDISKEMPLTLMTRPFGFDTLAVKVYELTSEGEWERAAIPALLIVALGFLPVLITLLFRRV